MKDRKLIILRSIIMIVICYVIYYYAAGFIPKADQYWNNAWIVQSFGLPIVIGGIILLGSFWRSPFGRRDQMLKQVLSVTMITSILIFTFSVSHVSGWIGAYHRSVAEQEFGTSYGGLYFSARSLTGEYLMLMPEDRSKHPDFLIIKKGGDITAKITLAELERTYHGDLFLGGSGGCIDCLNKPVKWAFTWGMDFGDREFGYDVRIGDVLFVLDSNGQLKVKK